MSYKADQPRVINYLFFNKAIMNTFSIKRTTIMFFILASAAIITVAFLSPKQQTKADEARLILENNDILSLSETIGTKNLTNLGNVKFLFDEKTDSSLLVKDGEMKRMAEKVSEEPNCGFLIQKPTANNSWLKNLMLRELSWVMVRLFTIQPERRIFSSQIPKVLQRRYKKKSFSLPYLTMAKQWYIKNFRQYGKREIITMKRSV